MPNYLVGLLGNITQKSYEINVATLVPYFTKKDSVETINNDLVKTYLNLCLKKKGRGG